MYGPYSTRLVSWCTAGPSTGSIFCRISQVREGDWLNTTIDGVTLNDTGKYVCYNDFKHFVVIDPGKKSSSVHCMSPRMSTHQRFYSWLLGLCASYTSSPWQIMRWITAYRLQQHNIYISYWKQVVMIKPSCMPLVFLSSCFFSWNQPSEYLLCTLLGLRWPSLTLDNSVVFRLDEE